MLRHSIVADHSTGGLDRRSLQTWRSTHGCQEEGCKEDREEKDREKEVVFQVVVTRKPARSAPAFLLSLSEKNSTLAYPTLASASSKVSSDSMAHMYARKRGGWRGSSAPLMTMPTGSSSCDR